MRGYTRFTQEQGDEAAARLAARFAEVAREVIESRGGTVVELRGDEALCVFGSPRQAVRAAVAFQQRCADEIRADPSLPLRVGIGLDAGEAVAVEGGYRGGALNLAARLCSLAGPGEVLVSEGVVHFGRRVDDVDYADRGQVRLKGLARPVRYHQARFPLDLPEGDDHPKRRSSTRLALIAVAVLIVLVAVVAAVALPDSGQPSSALPANAIGEFDAGSGKLVAQTQLSATPDSLTIGQGHVWTADPAGSRILGIDMRDRSVVSAGTGGGGVDAVAVSDDRTWVLHGDNASVVRLDPVQLTTVGDPVTVGAGASAAVVAGRDVWVANADDGTVQRIDGDTGRPSAPLPVGPQPVAMVVGLGSIWVLDEAGGTVTEIDPGSERVVDTHPVGVGGTSLVTGFGAIWIANPPAEEVIRFDPSDPTALRHVLVAGRPESVAVAGGSLWAGTTSGTLARIDPETLEVDSTIDVSAPVAALAGSGDRLYVATRTRLEEHRGGELRVVVEEMDSLDPAIAYVPESWSVLSITNDGLVAFQRVGGATGSLLVPDLATTIPEPADGGRTYRFVLRDGLRYSTGEAVRASDVRRAVERSLSATVPRPPELHGFDRGPGAAFFADLIGAQACRPGKACDMRRGVVVDDKAGTIEFHLTAPNPRFPYALALPFAAPVPDTAAPRGPVPATGAYMIKSFDQPSPDAPVGRVELVRNPRFRVWSAAARPDGFPDRIVWQVGGDRPAHLTQVERGDADVAPLTASDFTLTPRFHQLVLEHPSQVHTFATGQVLALFMNTTTPPFDDARVRRGLAFALDRRLMAKPAEDGVTCQILPPGIPGYRPYCPFTPGGGPVYRGPDLARAVRLVRASGTRGMPVTVWLTDIGEQRFLRYTARTLERLGYRVQTRYLSQDEYFPTILAPDSTAQIGGYGWVQDYPAPADFLGQIFSCRAPVNPSRFCNRAIDRQVALASRLERTHHAAAANLAWARADELVTDAAPWIPFVNPRDADFVSARVGNYLRNPQWGVLLEQLWVE